MAQKHRIPLHFSRIRKFKKEKIEILAGDIGGTKTNLALYEAFEGALQIKAEATYASSSFSSCIQILKKMKSEHPDLNPERICLGVAGPVLNGKVELTNLDWNLNASEILRETQVSEVALINDLEATAYGLAALDENDFITIHQGEVEYPGNLAIIAPGTGLGEGGLYWDGSSYHPFATEGGHTDFGARTREDVELLEFLTGKYGIVSWEKVIAGPAIADIYEFLRAKASAMEPAWLTEELEKGDRSALISNLAIDEKDPICMQTMLVFVRYLARQSSNLVLTMKATGGLYLGGGIPPKIAPLLLQPSYYHNFLDADRMQHLLKKVPLKIIRNSKAAMIGAALYGAYGAALENS
jgi:glucokinase